MTNLDEKIIDTSVLIEKQLPSFVRESNPKFISFLSSYYESQEVKYNSLDIVENLIEYYNIGHYTPSTLKEYTNITSAVSATDANITVLSTDGFPEYNGYIQIQDEIIFYKTKTKTQFKDCVRSTGAFTLEKIPSTNVVYTTGGLADSYSVNTLVYNISYQFTNEFFSRIKSEISPTLPEILAPELNISSFLKNISSFYRSKGTESSHKILFRILFNERRVKLKLNPSGSGAVINILNYSGDISSFQVATSGSGYYYEMVNNQLISPPIIKIIGSGTGAIDPVTLTTSKIAEMVVTKMTPSGGIAIDGVQVVNKGFGYIGPITAKIRERSFDQDQVVNCIDANNNIIGSGKVYSWDDSSRELILYQISGYFTSNSRVIGVGGEEPRARISAAYPSTETNKQGNPSIEIIQIDPKIERPKENVIKASSATFYERKILRCELISGAKNLDGIKLIELVQSRDLSYKIPGVTLEISEIEKLENNLYEFELDANLDYRKLFLPPSTTITQTTTLNSNSYATITVVDAKNFPTKSGKIFINGRIVEYATRNSTQFLNCRVISGTSPLIVNNLNKIYLYGRTCATSGTVNYFLNGYPNGDRSLSPIIFKIVAVPSPIKISDAGALYTSTLFKFDDVNTNSILSAKQYNFGSVDEVIIENAGSNYKINEKLKVDNTFSYGSGFTAYIAEIYGVNISAYEFVTQFGSPYIKITTSQPHNLQTEDLVTIDNYLIGKQKVFSILTSTQFLIPKSTQFTTLGENLSYTTTSKTAFGAIVKINISNKGNNYKKLPKVTGVDTTSGHEALFQLNSSTIGKIAAIDCESITGELIGDRKKQFNVKFPSTAKIKNNFQIASIKVISGGSNYRPTDVVKVNGIVDTRYKFNIITSSGIISDIQVINGGSNLNSIPTITVESQFGQGVQLEVSLSRKILSANDQLKFGSFTTPTAICKIINFDVQSSTVEFEKVSGNINNNDLVYLQDGSLYGNIFSVRTASAHANTSAYISFPYKFLDNYGFLNDSTQKIHDSDYYQDWSYSIASTKNTSEWRNEVIQNTHPSGFKLFGKNLIENQKPLFKNEQEVFNSSVIFKSTLANLLKLNVKLSECKTQSVSIGDISLFSVNDFVYGSLSGATGLVKSISESYIELYLLKDVYFTTQDFLFKVSKEFASVGTNESDFVFVFYSGILQKPIDSYYVSSDNLIPNFGLTSSDELIAHKLTNKFQLLDFIVDGNTLKLLKNNQNFTPGSAERLLISINGVVQASTFAVVGNVVTLDTNISSDDNIFILYQQNLKKLIFSGSGTNYTLNYTPTTSCNLLVFANSVFQSQLVTDFSVFQNQIILASAVNSSDIFGWYIDEPVACYLASTNLQSNKIITVRRCEIEKVNCHIESNAVKTPTSLYQITKDLLDGTVYTDPDNTTVYGYDTRFAYSNPEYSTSYGEVLNELIFNGTTTTFNLNYADGIPYTPVNGKNSLVVYVNNQILDSNQYTLSGSTITFNQAYSSGSKCTIIDFVSKYFANNTTSKSADLDRLNVVQDGIRKTFNLSDRGVPHYVKNTSDLFVIKNGNLKKPDSQYQSVAGNKITLVDAPSSSDNIKLCYFNRQLAPSKTKNVILDPLVVFNDLRTTFPLSLDGILFTPITAHHLFVVRNGVYQKPIVDYTITGSSITFSTAPSYAEEISIYYSYDGLNQNFKFDNFNIFNGSQTSFSLTSNYISTDVYSSSHLQVVKNGVYQYSETDYNVSGSSDARYITFASAPISTDTISIINYKSEDLVDVTNRFTQLNSTTLQYTSQTPIIDTSLFVIYVNGVLKVGNSWSFNAGTNVLTFTGFVSLTLDNVRILAFKTPKKIIDAITLTAGNFTYNLQVGGTTITTSLPTESSDLLVSVNGTRQLSTTSYTVSGSTITLNDPSLIAGDIVYIYQIGSSSFDTEVIDYLNDNYTKLTYKLQVNYKSFNPPSSSDVFVLRNGVSQNPGEDFTTGNGYITFSENITLNDEIYISYRHGSSEIGITNVSGVTVTLATTLNASEYDDLIIHVNGIPQFYGTNFTISGNIATLSSNIQIDSIFAIKYASTVFVDNIEDTPNGSRTRFRLLNNSQNLIASDVIQDADILVSVNGIIQYPGVQYNISPNRGIIEFLTAPQVTDDIFMIKMYGNQLVTLNSVSGSNTIYNLSQSIPSQEQENLIIFSNNGWKFNELEEYTYTTNSGVTLASANTSTYIFGIKFAGMFNLLDQINTPYNGVNTKFNLFLNQDNFMPPGTTELDSIPSESSLIVIKNGKFLEAGVEYTLQGDIKSQIQFNSPLISTDIVSVKCVGSFNKLNTITINSATNVIEMSLGVSNLIKLTMSSGGFPSIVTRDESVVNISSQNVLTRGGSTVPASLQNILIRPESIQITNSGVTVEIEPYYPNAEIERPRSHENQILVIKDGNIQSPLYDYYVNNNKIIFTNTVTIGSKLVILDFRGTSSDVKVGSRSYQINVGDKLYIDGESNERIITDIISPTVLKTTTYTGTKPSGFSATAATTNGKISSISITNGGKGYRNPVILRTLGTGFGAKATASINSSRVGVLEPPVTIQYPGYNQHGPQLVVPTTYAYSYKQKPLSTSNVQIGTKLTSAITSNAEVIPVANAQNFDQSDIAVQINSSTGSGATFRPFISNGRIRKVDVIASGIGYDDRDAEVVIVGGGGIGCILEVVLDGMGRVTSVIVRNSGEGYDTFKVIINRDMIEYTNIQSNQLIGCTRSNTSTTHAQNSIVYYDKFI